MTVASAAAEPSGGINNIAVDFIENKTTSQGVEIEGALHKDSGSGGIIATLAAPLANIFLKEFTYTPTVSGKDSMTCTYTSHSSWYIKLGKFRIGQVKVNFDITGTLSNGVNISIPDAADGSNVEAFFGWVSDTADVQAWGIIHNKAATEALQIRKYDGSNYTTGSRAARICFVYKIA